MIAPSPELPRRPRPPRQPSLFFSILYSPFFIPSRASKSTTRASLRVTALLALLALSACGPDLNAVNDRLRKTNLEQRDQIAKLTDQLNNTNATIADLRARTSQGLPPLQTLPPDRLAQLFTASRLQIQSSTDSADLSNHGVDGFRVFLRTFSADGQIVPAAGTLTIEAFELPPSPAQPRRIGSWSFSPEDMKKNWYTTLGLNHFAFSCPWTVSAPPTRQQIIFKAALHDALTGNTLQAELSKKISFTPQR